MKTSTSGRWAQSLGVYANPRVRAMLFLGFSSGLPFALVLTTLSARLRQAGIDRTTIGLFSLVGLAYSLKFFWSPVIDRVQLPVLGALGKRRSWMLLAQGCIATGLVLLAFANPAVNALGVAWLAVFTAFASSTQDIAVDAYRIEASDSDTQGPITSAYQTGYQVALICAGAGAMAAASRYGWTASYLMMAVCVSIGIATTLLISEPHADGNRARLAIDPEAVRQAISRMRTTTLVLIVAITAAVGLGLLYALPAKEVASALAIKASFGAILLVEATLLVAFVIPQFRPLLEHLVASVVLPLADFFQRFDRRTAVLLLLLVITYRLNYTTMGVAANPFYIDMGFTLDQIAFVSKLYGVIMTIAGAFLAGVLVRRMGVAKTLMCGIVALSAANLMYAHMAGISHPGIGWLTAAISVDNVANGIAGTAFITFMSTLTSERYTATQYALFGTLWSLPAKSIASQWGKIVDTWGYPAFFVYTAAIAIPAICLLLWLMWRERRGDLAPARQ